MCRVTMGHLRVTIGHLRVTIGHLRVIMGHLRLTIGYTTEFGERNIGLEIFQVAAQNLHDPNTALHCSAAAPIVVAAYIAGDLTLNLGKPLSGRKLWRNNISTPSPLCDICTEKRFL